MKLLELFWTFVKIGSLAFGGGYTIIAIVQSSLVERKKWLTQNELMDYMAMSQSLPGIIAINFSAFVGYKRAKFLGALTATVGVIVAPVTVVILLAGLIDHINDYPLLINALSGIQIAICALILSFATMLFKNSIHGILAGLIYLATIGIYLSFGISPAFLLIGAALVGLIYYRMKGKVFNQ